MSNMIPLSGMSTTDFVPNQFKEQKDPPTFTLRVPTFAIRDKIQAILFQRGFVPATPNEGRATLIDGLYDLYPEAEAEDHATFLEAFWSKADVYNELLQGWQIREAQRMFDIQMGVRKILTPEPLPPAPFTMRDQARHSRLLGDALRRHNGYREYQSRFLSAQVEEDDITARLFIFGWKNCVTKTEDSHIEIRSSRDDMDMLTEECVEGLRQWLQETGAPGVWDELKQEVRGLFGAPGKLEKNFDSPLDMNSSETGSLTSSGDLGTSDGSSTTSSTTPTPDTRSQATSGRSSRSRAGKKERSKAAPRKNGQTAVAS